MRASIHISLCYFQQSPRLFKDSRRERRTRAHACIHLSLSLLLVSDSPSISNALLETLVVLAHGHFLHPDAAALDQFLDHNKKSSTLKSNYHHRSLLDDQKNKYGGNPPPLPREREGGALFQPLDKTPSATTTTATTDLEATDFRVTNQRRRRRTEIARRSIGGDEACNDDGSITSESSLEESKTSHYHGQNGGLVVRPATASPATITAAGAGAAVRTARTTGGSSSSSSSRASDAAGHRKVAGDGSGGSGRGDGGGDGGGDGVVLVAKGKGTCMVREKIRKQSICLAHRKRNNTENASERDDKPDGVVESAAIHTDSFFSRADMQSDE